MMCEDRELAAIDRLNAILGVGVTAAAGLLAGAHAMLATGIGALIGAANFKVIRRLASGSVARAMEQTSPGQALGLVAALLGKMVALFVIVWAAQRLLRLSVLPLVAGLGVFVVSCLAIGLRAGAREAKA